MGMEQSKNGCSFGKITRERIDNFIKNFEDFKNNEFKHLADDVKKTANRPSWTVTALIIILSNLVVGLSLARILAK